MSELDNDWMRDLGGLLDELARLMDTVPADLRRMTELQNRLHNQYGEDGLRNLRNAMEEAQDGWMASNC